MSTEAINPTPFSDASSGSQSDWRLRMSIVLDTMREMSSHTDPEDMVKAYSKRMSVIIPADRRLSLSRRELGMPQFRITRSSLWGDEVNPWRDKHRLPLMEGGLLSDLLYSDEPHIIDNLEVKTSDPAYEHLAGQRSLIAIPLYDRGAALNMVVLTRDQPHAFAAHQFPEMVWMSNLFGRATHNLVLADQLKHAYEEVDRELNAVASIQRFLLPTKLPAIPGLRLAAHYQTSARAGGDYYDFMKLPDGRWGILIADVSGHGTPAAVFMAIAHTIVNTLSTPVTTPAQLLTYMNRHLATRYAFGATFITAFFAIYDPTTREVVYSSAGHPPPRIKHCSQARISALGGAQSLPLGIRPETEYVEQSTTLTPGDQIVFYTDGISEAQSPDDNLFGSENLDAVLEECREDADQLIQAVLAAVEKFTAGAPADDDRTLLVGKIV